MLQIKFVSTSCEIAVSWTPQNTFDDKTTMVEVMAMVPSGNKRLLGPVLIQIYDTIWCHWATMSLNDGLMDWESVINIMVGVQKWITLIRNSAVLTRTSFFGRALPLLGSANGKSWGQQGGLSVQRPFTGMKKVKHQSNRHENILEYFVSQRVTCLLNSWCPPLNERALTAHQQLSWVVEPN